MARVIYRGDDMSLYNKSFEILETFQYSYNIDVNGIKYRVSMNDCVMEKENDTRESRLGN